jgi:hypothetical protein
MNPIAGSAVGRTRRFFGCLALGRKLLTSMVPRGGIEPPTLRFSVPGKGWLPNARKVKKWLHSAIF